MQNKPGTGSFANDGFDCALDPAAYILPRTWLHHLGTKLDPAPSPATTMDDFVLVTMSVSRCRRTSVERAAGRITMDVMYLNAYI